MADKPGGREVEEVITGRQQVMKEIVEQRKIEADAEAKESVPETDEDGNLVRREETTTEEEDLSLEEAAKRANAAAEAEETPGETPSSETPSSETPPAAFDPKAEYDIEVEGQKIKVSGEKIIERGRATLQKETAAEYRLQLASELLEEARRRAAAPPTQGGPTPPVKEPEPPEDPAKIAEAIQFGTREQAVEAVTKILAQRTAPAVQPEQVTSLVARTVGPMVNSQLEFERAVEMVKKEYPDLLANDYMRRMFFVEENRRRAPKGRGGEGDTRPHSVLYKAIGDDLRKAFNMQPPAKPSAPSKTLEEKKEAKEKAPVVPRTASSRVEGEKPARAATTSEIIDKMRAARHQRPLNS